MEIIRNYSEMFDMATLPSHPMEAVVTRLVTKKILLPEVARRFLEETR